MPYEQRGDHYVWRTAGGRVLRRCIACNRPLTFHKRGEDDYVNFHHCPESAGREEGGDEPEGEQDIDERLREGFSLLADDGEGGECST